MKNSGNGFHLTIPSLGFILLHNVVVLIGISNVKKRKYRVLKKKKLSLYLKKMDTDGF